jgi:hypothetical protein
MSRPWWAKVAGTVGSSPVVVLKVFREYHPQVPLADDQHAVGEFGSEGADEPFGETVRPGAPRRNPDHADADIGEDGIERCCELTGSISDEEPELGEVIAEIHDQVADLLGGPLAVRVRGHAQQVHGPIADLQHEEHDLRKLRGKDLITKPGRTCRYQIPAHVAGTIAALLTLREQVIGPILAGVRSPRLGRKPATWTRVDRDYETLRINMQTLFHDLGITTTRAAAA